METRRKESYGMDREAVEPRSPDHTPPNYNAILPEASGQRTREEGLPHIVAKGRVHFDIGKLPLRHRWPPLHVVGKP